VVILELLKHIGGSSGTDEAGRIIRALDQASEREFVWAIEAGLGPMLLRATRDHLADIRESRHEILLSSDLTARLRHGLRVDTAKEVIDVCASVGATATLLKGISISEQYYPAGHLRTMSDVDVLLPAEAHPAVTAGLLARGYTRGIDMMGEDPHHDVPLNDPTGTVWVELHTRLYPRSSGLLDGGVFGSANVLAQTVRSEFHGLQVNRLTPEFQLAYIASSWMHDLTLFKVHPSFVTPLFDALLLLRATGQDLRWERLFGFLDNALAQSSLYALLTYLARRRLCEPSAGHDLGQRQHLVGPLELRAMHAMIDRYVVGGRYWNLPIPPPVPGRYNLRRQLRKRWSIRRLRA